MIVGKAVPRVDAYDKVTGRAKYADDYFHSDFLVAKVLHSTIANGLVKKIDTSAAEKIPGVVKIVTCFDVRDTRGLPRRRIRILPTASCLISGYGITVMMLQPLLRRIMSLPNVR